MYSVNLTKRIQTTEGMRFCPVVMAGNGRVAPDAVMVNGRRETHPEGSYYLEWHVGAKRLRLSVGKDAADAQARRLSKEAELKGVRVMPEPGKNALMLADAVRMWLEDVKTKGNVNKRANHGRHNTHGVYSTAMEYFLESCHKVNLADVDRRDLLKYAEFLQVKKDQSPRSTAHKFDIVVSFLKAQGIRGLTVRGDRPKYTLEEPEIYEQEELDALFKACTEEERLWFELLLVSGMREQELIFLYWRDVNFTASTIRVSHKPDLGWSPKAYKAREIPIPERMTKSLKEWKAKSDKACNLVFSTSGCRPKKDFLDCLKRITRRAGLDESTYRLHKFRATFATKCLWAGVDLRTVQDWMGHSDLESTMRYLKPSRSAETRHKVNAIFA
jgi:integrase/recombinase XerD